jgi:uncharacterized protein YkwD
MKKILFILFVLISTVSYGQKPTDIVDKNNINILYLEKLIFNGINNHRLINKKDSLIWDSILHIESQKHSKWMYDNNKFIHSKDVNFSGECCFIAGYSYGQSYSFNAKNLIRVWIESPGHNAALLDDRVNTGGVGIKIESNSHNGIYATLQMSYILTKEELDGIPEYTTDGNLIIK